MNTNGINEALLEQMRHYAEKQRMTLDDLMKRCIASTAEAGGRETLFEATFEQAAVGMAHVSLDGRWIRVNQRLCAILGYDADTLKSMTVEEITLPEDYAADLALAERLLAGEIPTYTLRKRYLHRVGQPVWVSITVSVLRDASLVPLHYITIIEDLTPLIRVEENLRRSEARLRSLLDSQTMFVLRCDLEGRTTYANRAFIERYRWLGIDLIGSSVMLTVEPEDFDKVTTVTMSCIRQPGVPFQIILRKRSPAEAMLWTLWEFVALRDEQNEVSEIQCMGLDITERYEMEAALRESEVRYRLLTESMSEYALSVIVSRDGSTGPIEWIVGDFEGVTGYPKSFYNDNPGVTLIHPADRVKVAADIACTVAGLPTMTEYRIITRSGEVAWLHASRVPVWDEAESRVIRFHSAVQNITERKRVEQIALDQALLKLRVKQERERNALIQRTISALAHDIRHPLSGIANSRHILSQYGDRLTEAERQERLNAIGRHLQYALDLLDDTVAMIRDDPSVRATRAGLVDLGLLCQAALDELRETLGSKDAHDLAFVNQAAVGVVSVDEVLVSRILFNLLSNAIKYSPDGGQVRLELDQRDDWLVIRVSDQGIGISEADQPHIFESFYRADAVAEIDGSGLGLNIVQECVRLHRGRIHVRSALGAGSTFTVELPQLAPPIASAI